MSKLTMMIGLPGSGKSDLAIKIVGSGNGCVRVNRDDLRAMMYGPHGSWSGKKEDLVIKQEKVLALTALGQNKDVIIDDTNLSDRNRNMWSEFARQNGASFDMIDLRSVEVDECINRDFEREKRVGRAVIERMALWYKLLPVFGMRKQIAIFDIDGTLADGEERRHFIKNGNKDWASYRQLAYSDKPIQPIIDWLKETQRDHMIFIVSGRGTDEGLVTEKWLYKNHIHPDRLFMRQGGDYREDSIIKQEILDKIVGIYGKDPIKFVVDDRPRVVRMWRANGLKVYPVNQESWEGVED